MKICIVTIMDYRNYGNRLQNYALTMLLRDEGWDVYSGIQVRSKEDWEKGSSKIESRIKHLVPFWIYRKKAQGELLKLGKERMQDKRRSGGITFTNQYIKTLPTFIVKNDRYLAKILESYHFDYFIAGSDQVWNPIFAGKDYEFLTFAPKDKRLSFAASFGIDEIPLEQRERYCKVLGEMKNISVRETQGIKIARSLTGRDDVELTLDPTLLLEKQRWEMLVNNSIIKKPEHYVATYFLGELPELVKAFADEKDIQILSLNDKKQPELYSIDPVSFISILHDADYVFTDSFHALAFSLIFHRQFYVFRRNEKGQVNMFSRLEGLLRLFNLTDRIVSGDMIKEEQISDIQWERIDGFLLSQKAQSVNMLKRIMLAGIENEN